MEYKPTIKLGTMLALAIGVTATIVKLIQPGIESGYPRAAAC